MIFRLNKYFLFTIIVSNFAFTQTITNKLNKLELRGNVKNIETIVFNVPSATIDTLNVDTTKFSVDLRVNEEYDTQRRKLKYIRNEVTNNLLKHITYEYQNKNIIINQKNYNKNSELIQNLIHYCDSNYVCYLTSTFNGSNVLISNNYIKKNSQGQIYRKYEYTFNSKTDSTLAQNTTFDYDSLGYMCGTIVYSKGLKIKTKTLIKNNTKGKPIQKDLYLKDDSKPYSEKYLYNEKNLLVETSCYHPDGRFSNKILNIYDSLFQIISTINYDSKLKISSKILTYYNSFGLVTCKLVYSEDMLSEKVKYIYKFDKNNNWIEQIKFSNNTPIAYIKRIISYYE